MTSRRQFLKVGALAGTGLLVPWKFGVGRAFGSQQVLQTPLAGSAIAQFQDPLPNFAVLGRADGTKALTVSMENHIQQVLPPGFPATEVWAYKIAEVGGNLWAPNYPAFTIVAQRGVPTDVIYVNNLHSNYLYQLLTVDQTLHWADPLGFTHDNGCMMNPLNPVCKSFYTGPVPAATHLHGGEVPSVSDGHPDSWFTPNLIYKGPAWAQGVSDHYHYPNTQEATTLWFHDHTLGATRLNVYAGLAGFYLLRDWSSERNDLPGGPTDNGGPSYEVEIVIQDRMFDINGQWFFPDIGLNPEHPYWVPEFLGDAIVVNGKTWPYLNVQPRRYRFRFLNGSNARFYELFLVNPATKMPGPAFWQIGTDGGLTQTPVKLNDPAAAKPPKLVLAPGERADVIIDFSGYSGQTLLMRNTARAPYPKGAPPQGSTTGQIMQFRVAPGQVTDNSYNPAAGGSPRNQTAPIVLLTNGAGALVPGVTPTVTRQLTLNEVMGPGGPLEVLVNNTKWDGTMSPNIDPTQFPDGITEMPTHGSTEVWEIINLTADAHPIHLHLVQFQLLNRQNFNVNKYTAAYNAAFPGGLYLPAYGPPLAYGASNADGAVGGNPAIGLYLQGPARPPEPNEVGWKDTVIMYPGQVTRIVARWMPTDVPAGQSGAFPFDPTTGPGYVWHCHIIDHEDNEMMRPYKVQP